ncbi:MAG: RluA family pseudouridine synthase [Candidatus Gracilibacteria bacterium]|nr:RluA family pseudouridine synthase [Candidatus Gracilibacteria bacterium]
MKQIIIEKNDSEQRLDKFLKKLLKNASRSLIYKFNRKGKIKINKKKKDNEYKLQIGDELKIFISDNEYEELTKDTKQAIKIDKKLDKKNIMYEDKSILVINKNPFLNVHPGDFKTKEISLIDQVHDYLGNQLNSFTFKPALAHRIDRNTSGIIIIGKQKHTLDHLVKGFKNHDIKKIYYAIVLGKLENKTGKIDKKILRQDNVHNENKIIISEKGQKALTYYKVLEEKVLETKNGKQDISILEVELKTGRMHQIRVHLASIGHPIIGDNTYGNKNINSYIAKNFGLNRQALHSYKTEFYHPDRKKNVSLKAKLKPDLEKFLSYLK